MNGYKSVGFVHKSFRISFQVFTRRFSGAGLMSLHTSRLMKRVCFDVSEESAASHFTPIEFGSGSC